MDKIVECVPNFSTSDPTVIEEITKAIKSVEEVKLLNVEPDADYNRTVVTFVGTPKKARKAAFKAIAVAAELIDMKVHKGEHPRMGATDVCPFIPVADVTEEECIKQANKLAKNVAEDLGIPTYLYGKAAKSQQRFKLSDIRKGEYEGLAEKIIRPEWKPDFGKAEFNAKSGATVIGVRGFLVAYNVNIESEDVSIAKEIGGLVRESGRLVEKNGEKVREPGLLKGIQGMGFALERPGRKLTQVSMNVVDFKQFAKPHEAFEEVKRLAEERGTKVTGSEVVGLIPLEAILEAGKFYDPNEIDHDKLISIAVKNLGLSDLDHFNPRKKIVELMIEDRLIDLVLTDFIDDLASDKPAPGGGSVAALGGSLAAALATMVGNLSIGKEKFKDVEEELKEIKLATGDLQSTLSDLIDEDTDAFNQVMASYRMSKDNPNRPIAIQEAMIHASKVPLNVAQNCYNLMDHIRRIAEIGNKNAISDAGVSGLFAEAAIRGAIYNVRINLGSIKDEEIKNQLTEKVNLILSGLDEKKDAIAKVVEANI